MGGVSSCCRTSEDKDSLSSHPYHGVSQSLHMEPDFSKVLRQADQGAPLGAAVAGSKGLPAESRDEPPGIAHVIPPPPTQPSPAAEYMITLDKATGHTLGVDVDLADGQTMLVDKLDAVGLIADWNRRNPDLEVRINHRIVEVNGVRGDAQAMTVKAKNDTILRIVLRRD
mmetsp:Transcript_54498/g.127321  ORF Transcript_54498/g.127321 Transcript_54498/m.127321 type:complete len:170 (-) Transcript_54498:91-600(-)